MNETKTSWWHGHLARERSWAGCPSYSRRKSPVPFASLLIIALCLPLAWGASSDGRANKDYIGPTTAGVSLAIPTSGPLSVSVEKAILQTLENNQELRVERLAPRLRRTAEDMERAAFDPTLTGAVSYSRDRTERESKATDKTVETTTKRTNASLGISEFLPTGTNIDIGLSANRTWATDAGDQNTAGADITITQALLRGGGLDALNVNLASLRQARLDTRSSEYELRGFAESLVARVEETYWDYALAQRQIKIFTDSLNLAQQQLREAEERIAVGKLADIERAAAQAEVALREEALINARSTLATTRLQLLRLLNPPGETLWNREVVLENQPATTSDTLADVESHLQVGFRMRPDLNQARLGIQRGDLDIVKTRNGLLPRLDFFITLGRTGYADSFGGSVRGADGHGYDGTVGLNFEYPILNRAARARYERSRFSLDQLQESLQNMEQLVQVDIRTAHIEVNRLKEQITATAATRKLQEESVRSETEKFRVGKSTTLLVARAQRDLLSSQIDEIKAIVSHLKALVDLYRLEGSLLERWGLSAPGRQPVSEMSPARR